MTTILFEPSHKIGDRVALKLNPKKEMIIDAYSVYRISEEGEATYFTYRMYDEDGTTYYFGDTDLIEVQIEY